jgi:hypothetical protein
MGLAGGATRCDKQTARLQANHVCLPASLRRLLLLVAVNVDHIPGLQRQRQLAVAAADCNGCCCWCGGWLLQRVTGCLG